MIISIELTGKKVFVIGDVPEAFQRAEAARLQGAQVSHIRASEARWFRDHRSARHRLRRVSLRGAFLVIATDRDPDLNAWLYRRAGRYGYLLNTLDERNTCTFTHVAVRRPHPEIEIAVATGGSSPAFAAVLAGHLAQRTTAADLVVYESFKAFRSQLRNNNVATFGFDWSGLDRELRETLQHRNGDPRDLLNDPRLSHQQREGQ